MYQNIQTLSVEYDTDRIDQIEQVFSLASVERLNFAKKIQCLCSKNLLEKSLHVSQLIIPSSELIRIVDSIDDHYRMAFEQVKKLHIEDLLFMITIERVSGLCPRLEEISSWITTEMDVLRAIERFRHLRSATFRWMHSYEQSPLITSQCLEDNYPMYDSTFHLTDAQLCLWID